MRDIITPKQRMDNIMGSNNMGYLRMTRKKGQAIMIGDTEVIIEKNERNVVTVGVIADKNISVDRKEIRESKNSGISY